MIKWIEWPTGWVDKWKTFQRVLTIFKESVSIGTILHLFDSHAKKSNTCQCKMAHKPKERIV